MSAGRGREPPRKSGGQLPAQVDTKAGESFIEPHCEYAGDAEGNYI